MINTKIIETCYAYAEKKAKKLIEKNMFHVKQFVKNLTNKPLHELFFYVFLFIFPIQTRILYNPDQAFIDWYFNYHLAFFFYFTDIILAACLVSWMFGKSWRTVLGKRIFWLILAFFIVILLSLLHVKRTELGWYQSLKCAEMLILVLYISETLKEKAQYILAAWILFTSAVFQAIIGLLQFHVQQSLNLDFLGEYIALPGTPGLATIGSSTDKIIRAYGTFPHPNILGAFLVLGLILGLFLVSCGTFSKFHPRENGDPENGPRIKSGVVKIITFIGIFVITLGIFTTFSRVSWLAAALAITSFLIYYVMKQRRRLVISILILVLVSCATVMTFASKTLKTRVSDNNSASITDRYYFNRLGLDLIRRFPVLGVGVGNYVDALQDKNKLEAWQYQPAHNIYIFVAAELGLLGLGLFILILFEIFSRLKSIPAETITFTFAVLGILFLVMGQFDHYFVTIQQGRLMFFTVLGMIAALPNIYAKKSD